MLGLGKAKREIDPVVHAPSSAHLQVFCTSMQLMEPGITAEIERELLNGQRCELVAIANAGAAAIHAPFVLSLFLDPSQLDPLADAVLAKRQAGAKTTLIIAINPPQLAALGRWLDARANVGKLAGVRLILGSSVEAVAQQLQERRAS